MHVAPVTLTLSSSSFASSMSGRIKTLKRTGKVVSDPISTKKWKRHVSSNTARDLNEQKMSPLSSFAVKSPCATCGASSPCACSPTMSAGQLREGSTSLVSSEVPPSTTTTTCTRSGSVTTTSSSSSNSMVSTSSSWSSTSNSAKSTFSFLDKSCLQAGSTVCPGRRKQCNEERETWEGGVNRKYKEMRTPQLANAKGKKLRTREEVEPHYARSGRGAEESQFPYSSISSLTSLSTSKDSSTNFTYFPAAQRTQNMDNGNASSVPSLSGNILQHDIHQGSGEHTADYSVPFRQSLIGEEAEGSNRLRGGGEPGAGRVPKATPRHMSRPAWTVMAPSSPSISVYIPTSTPYGEATTLSFRGGTASVGKMASTSALTQGPGWNSFSSVATHISTFPSLAEPANNESSPIRPHSQALPTTSSTTTLEQSPTPRHTPSTSHISTSSSKAGGTSHPTCSPSTSASVSSLNFSPLNRFRVWASEHVPSRVYKYADALPLPLSLLTASLLIPPRVREEEVAKLRGHFTTFQVQPLQKIIVAGLLAWRRRRCAEKRIDPSFLISKHSTETMMPTRKENEIADNDLHNPLAIPTLTSEDNITTPISCPTTTATVGENTSTTTTPSSNSIPISSTATMMTIPAAPRRRLRSSRSPHCNAQRRSLSEKPHSPDGKEVEDNDSGRNESSFVSYHASSSATHSKSTTLHANKTCRHSISLSEGASAAFPSNASSEQHGHNGGRNFCAPFSGPSSLQQEGSSHPAVTGLPYGFKTILPVTESGITRRRSGMINNSSSGGHGKAGSTNHHDSSTTTTRASSTCHASISDSGISDSHIVSTEPQVSHSSFSLPARYPVGVAFPNELSTRSGKNGEEGKQKEQEEVVVDGKNGLQCLSLLDPYDGTNPIHLQWLEALWCFHHFVSSSIPTIPETSGEYHPSLVLSSRCGSSSPPCVANSELDNITNLYVHSDNVSSIKKVNEDEMVFHGGKPSASPSTSLYVSQEEDKSVPKNLCRSSSRERVPRRKMSSPVLSHPHRSGIPLLVPMSTPPLPPNSCKQRTEEMETPMVKEGEEKIASNEDSTHRSTSISPQNDPVESFPPPRVFSVKEESGEKPSLSRLSSSSSYSKTGVRSPTNPMHQASRKEKDVATTCVQPFLSPLSASHPAVALAPSGGASGGTTGEIGTTGNSRLLSPRALFTPPIPLSSSLPSSSPRISLPALYSDPLSHTPSPSFVSFAKLPVPPFQAIHSTWCSPIGFQQEDPSTDFRGGGVLGLVVLLLYVIRYPKQWCLDLLEEKRSGYFPAATSINITYFLSAQLGIRYAPHFFSQSKSSAHGSSPPHAGRGSRGTAISETNTPKNRRKWRGKGTHDSEGCSKNSVIPRGPAPLTAPSRTITPSSSTSSSSYSSASRCTSRRSSGSSQIRNSLASPGPQKKGKVSIKKKRAHIIRSRMARYRLIEYALYGCSNPSCGTTSSNNRNPSQKSESQERKENKKAKKTKSKGPLSLVTKSMKTRNSVEGHANQTLQTKSWKKFTSTPPSSTAKEENEMKRMTLSEGEAYHCTQLSVPGEEIGEAHGKKEALYKGNVVLCRDSSIKKKKRQDKGKSKMEEKKARHTPSPTFRKLKKGKEVLLSLSSSSSSPSASFTVHSTIECHPADDASVQGMVTPNRRSEENNSSGKRGDDEAGHSTLLFGSPACPDTSESGDCEMFSGLGGKDGSVSLYESEDEEDLQCGGLKHLLFLSSSTAETPLDRLVVLHMLYMRRVRLAWQKLIKKNLMEFNTVLHDVYDEMDNWWLHFGANSKVLPPTS